MKRNLDRLTDAPGGGKHREDWRDVVRAQKKAGRVTVEKFLSSATSRARGMEFLTNRLENVRVKAKSQE